MRRFQPHKLTLAANRIYTPHKNTISRLMPPRAPYTTVPRHSTVQPGTSVSIILKQDQPTGRQVSGVVSEILTRGDHPRGVKVRLRDGRVGRVQKLLADGEVAEEGGYEVNAGEDFSGGGSSRGGRGRGRGSRGRGRRGGRQFFDGADEYTRGNEGSGREYDLTSFIKVDKRLRGSGGSSAAQQQQNSQGGDWWQEESAGKTARCPVCGDFEGDTRAVEQHVESHFA